MIKSEHHVTIDRPADEIFAFLADGSNNPRWQPPVVETTRTSGPLTVGTRFQQVARHPFGFRVSTDYRVVAYEPSRVLALEPCSGGPIRPTQRYELTADTADTTTVSSVVEYQPSGLARFALPVLALLHPLFAWEASWIDNIADSLPSTVDSVDPVAGSRQPTGGRR